ncbi:GumC family protein [Sulfitobacter sp. SK012]|uniref:GumC family protein n=1 Tax=Sulfitobacter sp. SK012 TaxID=1389005 RepID=UPI0013B38152|nr:Wzz/FepE/Etk N-terminal domain-containing protein [Sulfitobacter sp. SK012]
MNEFISRRKIEAPAGAGLKASRPSTVHASQDADRADLGRIMRAAWRHKWFVLACTVATAVVFFVLTSMQPTRYTAVSTIMLDPREQQVIAAQDEVVSDLKLNNSILESEVAVLRSSTMMGLVVDQIGIARFATIDPATQQPGALERVKGAIKFILGQDAAPEMGLLSPEMRQKNRIVSVLRQGVSINRLGDSYVIQISVQSTDQALSAEVANALAAVYIKGQLKDREQTAEAATAWLAAQVSERRDALQSAEHAVEGYERLQLGQTGTSIEAVQQQLLELNKALALAQSDRATQEARLSQIVAQIAERGPLAVAEAESTGYLTTLREERDKLAQRDAGLASSLQTGHPDRRNIASELARYDKVITQEVSNVVQAHRNEIDVLNVRVASLGRSVAALEEQTTEISASSRQLRQLEGEADVARQSYQDLLTRLGETRAQVELQRAEAKIVNPAQIPTGPSAPRPMLMGAFGATLGLTGSLIVGLMFQMLGAGFLQTAQLEQVTGLRVYATLPRDKLAKPRQVLDLIGNPAYSLLAERIRQLRGVLMSSLPARSRSILLLSSVPDEGKTTTALALAHFYAKSGARTVLLDLDTRRSSLRHALNADAPYELFDHLNGDVELSCVISRPEGEGFHFISAGKEATFPIDEISSGRIKGMIGNLKLEYDVVIIDAPPVLSVSDGLLIAPLADAVLYLVRWRSTPRKAVLDGLSALANVRVAPKGLVLSMADMTAEPGGYAQDYSYY